MKRINKQWIGALALLFAIASSTQASETSSIAALDTQVTEEGQRVAYDLYTWQRRELAKKLPLDQPWPSDADLPQRLKQFGIDQSIVAQHLPTPSRVFGDIYLVGSTPALTYVIDCGPDGLALVDPGLDSDYEAITASVKALKLGKSIRWVINTHAHFDHAMASARFRSAGAKIMVGAADADAMERATRVTGYFALPPVIAARYPKTIVDHRLTDGEELRLGTKIFHVIDVPGHTSGAIALVLQEDGKNILFSGDTILFDYRLAFQGTAYADNAAYARSLAKLNGFALHPNIPFRWDILLPGHGTIVLDRAWLDIDKGQSLVDLSLVKGQPIHALPFATQNYRRFMFGRP